MIPSDNIEIHTISIIIIIDNSENIYDSHKIETYPS